MGPSGNGYTYRVKNLSGLHTVLFGKIACCLFQSNICKFRQGCIHIMNPLQHLFGFRLSKNFFQSFLFEDRFFKKETD